MTTLTAPVQNPQTTEQGDVKYLDQLVGEGKKFRDAEALAKGKAEADAHIARLEQEQRNLRADLDQRLTLEKVMDKISSLQGPTTSTPVAPQPGERVTNEPTATGLKAEDIERLLDQKLTQKQQEAITLNNIQSVRSELAKAWGSDFPTKVESKAQELGVTVQYLESLAGSQPKLFLESMGIKPQAMPTPPSFAPPQSSARPGPSGPSGSGARNFKHYETLRKADPSSYWSPRIQGQMHRDAQAMGESFYS